MHKGSERPVKGVRKGAKNIGAIRTGSPTVLSGIVRTLKASLLSRSLWGIMLLLVPARLVDLPESQSRAACFEKSRLQAITVPLHCVESWTSLHGSIT